MTSQINSFPQPAVMKIPGGFQNAPASSPCRFLEVDGRRAVIESIEKLPVGAALSIEYNDALILGEVIRCVTSESGGYRLEMRIEQMLTGLQSLMRLRTQLLGEDRRPAAVSRSMAEVYA